MVKSFFFPAREAWLGCAEEEEQSDAEEATEGGEDPQEEEGCSDV